MSKTGLILEGGAMRGLFTAGVLDVFLENDIQFDGLIGVSAGAVFGCSYKSGQKGRSIRYNLRFCKDPRYCSFRSLIKTGDLYGAEFCYKTLPQELDPFDNDAFRRNPCEFFVVCTDTLDGSPVYTKLENAIGADIEWMRASASMPLVSRPVVINGKQYLDGGISDSVPLKHFETKGFDKNIVILTQPKGYRKEKPSHLSMMRLMMKNTPAVYEAMCQRHEVYNQTMDYIEQKEMAGEILVIRPPRKLPVGHISHKAPKLLETYEIGVGEGNRLIEQVRAFLTK